MTEGTAAMEEVYKLRVELAAWREEATRLAVECADAQEQADRARLATTEEWALVFATLGTSVVEALEIVKEIELKPSKGHPFYWGQMSLLKTLRRMADDDLVRFGGTPSPQKEN